MFVIPGISLYRGSLHQGSTVGNFSQRKVDLNSMKFVTRSIDQIECHSKHTKVADSLFTTIISFNTVRNEAKKVNYSSHTIVDFYT